MPLRPFWALRRVYVRPTSTMHTSQKPLSANRPTALLDERFLLLDSLGRGGMGQVVRAFDGRHEKIVALKIPVRPEDPAAASMLALEFESWSRLRHRNVVQALGMATARSGPLPPGTPYLILERFRGAPLPRALPPGATDAGGLERVAREALAALAHVHASGLVHRDVKPTNLLVRAEADGELRLKLTDFGLAKRSGTAGTPGQLSGCLPYLAPEAILGAPLDGRADLYALGVALFRQAAGRHPAADTLPDALIRWHLTGERPAREDLGMLPDRLARFVLRLLERSPADRPASAIDAQRLLCGVPVRAGVPRRSGLEKGEVAALRLAFDACTRGARRVYRMPDGDGRWSLVAREASILAAARGVDLLRLGASGSGEDVVAVTLRLLRSTATSSAQALRASIERAFPIAFVGSHPVRAEAQGTRPFGRRSATLLADLLIEAAASRPVALLVARAARSDNSVAEVVRALAAREQDETEAGGGLLLLACAAGGCAAAGEDARQPVARCRAPRPAAPLRLTSSRS